MSHQDHESLNAVEDLLEINVVFRRMVMISQSEVKRINNVPLVHCVSTPMTVATSRARSNAEG